MIMKKRIIAAFLITFLWVSIFNLYSQITPREGKLVPFVLDGKITFSWPKNSNYQFYELKIFSKENLVLKYLTFTKKNKVEVPILLLNKGNFIWRLRGIKPGKTFKFTREDILPQKYQNFSIGITSTPQPQTPQANNVTNFKPTGNILIVPVEFLDVKFSVSPQQQAKALMEKIRKFYKDISYNSPEVDKILSYDVLPFTVKLEYKRKHYGKDKFQIQDTIKNLFSALKKRNLNSSIIQNAAMTDCGDFSLPWAGSRKLKEDVLLQLFEKYKIPVTHYKKIIYALPGKGGNFPGSDQLWPCSVGGSPKNIIYDPKKKQLSGDYLCGIICPIEQSYAILAHEMGHQLGLPDLYPYPNKPNRNLGRNALMASGNWEVGMMALSKMKSYPDEFHKKDWVSKKVLKITQPGEYKLYSRDSSASPIALICPLPKGGYYIIEVFDRNRWDKGLPAYVKFFWKAKAGVLVYWVDNLDVESISRGYAIPRDFIHGKITGQFFLPGGSIDEGKGVKIKVLSLKNVKDYYEATIKVDGQPKN